MLSRTFVCRTHWITRKQLYRGRLRSTTHRQLMQDVKQVKMIATLFIKKKMMTTYSMARKPICSWYREIQNHYIRYIKTQNKSATLSMRHIKKKKTNSQVNDMWEDNYVPKAWVLTLAFDFVNLKYRLLKVFFTYQ